MRSFNRKSQKPRRKELRNRPTTAEHLLWYQLRGAKLDGRKFRRQHGVGPYIVDFYCPEERLAIELDGGIHDDPDVKARDQIREQFLRTEGITVLRFNNEHALGDPYWMIETIRATWKGRERKSV